MITHELREGITCFRGSKYKKFRGSNRSVYEQSNHQQRTGHNGQNYMSDATLRSEVSSNPDTSSEGKSTT